jgi:hypothetical protein
MQESRGTSTKLTDGRDRSHGQLKKKSRDGTNRKVNEGMIKSKNVEEEIAEVAEGIKEKIEWMRE